MTLDEIIPFSQENCDLWVGVGILATSRPWPVAETQATYDVYTATKADRCESQLPLLLAAITTPQYQSASPSSLRHPIDTSSNNGDLYEIIDVT